MRWQDADLTRLPTQLVEKLASGQYREAAVGSCPAQNLTGSFTAYRRGCAALLRMAPINRSHWYPVQSSRPGQARRAADEDVGMVTGFLRSLRLRSCRCGRRGGSR